MTTTDQGKVDHQLSMQQVSSVHDIEKKQGAIKIKINITTGVGRMSMKMILNCL